MPFESLALSGRVALVTGGSRGIGRAIVELLARRGAAVAFTYKDREEPARALVRELESKGARVWTAACDVADEAAVQRMVADATAALGPIDILVNNAGVTRDGYLMMMDREKWDAVLDAWYAEPLTLVHGDSHLGNCFETPAGIGMLDFQGLHWGQGIRDVQYHLIDSIEPDRLAECEDALVAGYLAALAGSGVHLAADVARAQYRALSFQTLVVALVSLGLGSLTEREATVRTVLRRSVAAVDRLGFGDWLAGL